MVVHPTLVGVLLRGRSAWKALAETDYFVLQHHPRHISNAFRIITRGFPHYRVAEGDSEELLQEELEFLSRMARVSIQGKITSKKISTWLKSTFERNSILAIAPPVDRLTQPDDIEDSLDPQRRHDDGYLSDTSFTSHEDTTSHSLSNVTSRRPLRRAISLEDLTSATAIHHQPHTSDLLDDSRSWPKQTTPSHDDHLGAALQRPASSASIYQRRRRSSKSSEVHIATMSIGKDSVGFKHNGHAGLPTPDVSPEELSDSSEELVIIQGDLLEEAKSARSVDRIRPSLPNGAFPGAELEVDTATVAEGSSSTELVAKPWSWLTDPPFIDALVNWIEGPDHPVQQKGQDKDKPNPWLDIPLQFIALLTYPEPDPKNGNKMSLTMVRETSFVRQRRKTLMMLTAYTLVVRYCSFDFFILVLFASNCAMLFLMKNSGRMNVNMAKRAVRQRVGWAKQWAGGIFRRGGNINTSSSNGNSSSTANTGSISVSNPNSGSIQSPNRSEYARQQQSSPVQESIGTTLPETSSQMKRRGLFGKRKTVDSISSSASIKPASLSDGVASLHGSYATAVDGPSATSPTFPGATTPKRRFFRRSNNSNNSQQSSNGVSRSPETTTKNATGDNSSSSAISISQVPISSPVPIPTRSTTSSLLSNTTLQQTVSTPGPGRYTAMNTPLPSSPLGKSYSQSYLQFSPAESFKPSESDADLDASTSPSFLQGIMMSQRTGGSMPPLTLPPPRTPTTTSPSRPTSAQYASMMTRLSSESTDTVWTSIGISTAQKVSGLSQLLGRCSPSIDASQKRLSSLKYPAESPDENGGAQAVTSPTVVGSAD